MADPKETIKRAAAILLGAILYAILNWIPVIGALISGLIVGYLVGGGFKGGFKHATYASALGAITVSYMIASYGLQDVGNTNKLIMLFMIWVTAIWHLAGIFFSGLGGGFGAVGKDIFTVIPKGFRDLITRQRPKPGIDYIICSKCGQGNVSSATTCIGCGKNLNQDTPT